MSQVIYLPALKKPSARAQAPVPNSAIGRCRLADERRLVHDLKNCMSVLLLGLGTLDREGDQWTVSARSRQVFEDAVLDMNRIVSELIHKSESGFPTSRV